MGLIGSIIGASGAIREVGETVGGVAEVFVGNAAEREAASEARLANAVRQMEGEFVTAGARRFDRFVNALNRLPRPIMTLGTLGLFTYAMAAPSGFSERMQGLALVPEPLWWLMGAIVSFYFGARELHHYRLRPLAEAAPEAATGGAKAKAAKTASGAKATVQSLAGPLPAEASAKTIDPDFNAAVEDWRRTAA